MARVLMVTRPLECPAELCRFLDTVVELSAEHTVRIGLISNCPRLQRECERLDIEVHGIPCRGIFDVAYLVHVHRLMSAGIADEFHIWDAARQLESLAIARWTHRPVVTYEIPWRDFGFRSLSAHALAQGCDVVDMRQSPSEFPGNHLAISRDDGVLRNKLGIPNHSFVAGVGSQLSPGQGLKDAIWSVDLIKNVRDDLHLVILGDGRLRWRLNRFARQCKVEDRVHFAGAKVGIEEFVASIDCLWLPNHRAGDLRLAQYCIRSGIPIVASDMEMHRRIVSHDETGLIFAVGSRRGLAGQTYRLLKSPEFALRLAHAARDKDPHNESGQRRSEAASRVA